MEYIEINYLAVFVAGILAMVIGALWYGPLFGDLWMKVIGADKLDKEEREKMQKSSGPLYLVQFILVIVQFGALNYFFLNFASGNDISVDLVQNVITTFWVWLFFIAPTIFGISMWNNDKRQVAISRFLIQSGYQLIIFIIAAALVSILV